MGKIKVAFSDVDGTLLNSKKKMSPRTVEAVKALQNQGIEFVIISARSPSGIYPILEENGFNCPVISYSGCLIVDENRQVVYHHGMPKSRAAQVIDFIESQKFNVSWNIYSVDEWISKDRTDPRIINEETIVKARSIQGGIEDVTDDQVNKVLCICDPAETVTIENQLKAQFPELSIVKSSDILIEVMEQGCTKAMGVTEFCKANNIAIEDTIAFGDNYNDVEMLELVGQGFLMGNAPAPLKERIPNHTADNDHDGIYDALKNINLI